MITFSTIPLIAFGINYYLLSTFIPSQVTDKWKDLLIITKEKTLKDKKWKKVKIDWTSCQMCAGRNCDVNNYIVQSVING